MKLYCVKCKAKTPSSVALRTKTYRRGNRTTYMVKGKCSRCGTNQSLIISKQAAHSAGMRAASKSRSRSRG